MIHLEKIEKRYVTAAGPSLVLKGIDLFIGKGEFVSIMGPSGSGKSTLAAILGCLTKASGGRYELDGIDVNALGSAAVAALRNQKIGFVFQDFNLLDGMTAAENVELPLVYAGMGPRARRKRAIAALEKVNLADRVNHHPKQLSGGQKQRVAIARALVNDPSLIFADEPTGALDAKNTTDVMVLLQSLNLAGHTIVQVTHAPEDAAFSKRIVHIADGLVVRDEPVENYDVASRTKDEASAGGAQRVTPQVALWGVAGELQPSAPEDVRAVKRLYRETSTPEAAIAAVRALVRLPGRDFSPLLVQLARHKHWAVRAELVKLVDVKQHDQAVGFFLAGLRDDNAWVRYSSLRQLAPLGTSLQTSFGTDDIIRCLEDADERVRAAAVVLIQGWRAPALLATVERMAAADPNPRVRANALECLAVYRGLDAATDAAILAVWRQAVAANHHRVASTAVPLLYPLHPAEALAAATALRTSSVSVDRAAAAWALGMIPEPAVVGESLLDMARSEDDPMVVNQVALALVRQARHGLSFTAQLEHVLGPAPTPPGAVTAAAG